MALTYGFYNSLNGDRKYNAMDISRLFDGLIKDGVFMSIGSAFIVEASSERVVNVGIGRAWFNNTWTYNDAILPLRLSACDILLNRIDAVVIEVNANDNIRKNDVKIIKGEEASEPQRPILSKENNCYQYPLAYIYVAGTADGITQANITNMVGTSECPFVTGIMQSMDADALIAKWDTQWSEWKTAIENDNDTWSQTTRDGFTNEMTSWIAAYKSDLELTRSGFVDFRRASESDFTLWFDAIKGNLSEDAAGNLQNQVDAATKAAFERYYSLVDKTTKINKNSDGKTSSIVETSSEAVSTTTFKTTDNGKIITTQIVPNSGNYNYTKTTKIEAIEGGKLITESYEKTVKPAE